MKRPRIEEQILKQRNLSGTTASFLAVGGAALIAAHGWTIAAVLIPSITLYRDAFDLNTLSKKGRKSVLSYGFRDPTFKMRMGNWIKKYINETDDLIEKKYRTTFLNLWFAQKRSFIKEVIPSNFNLFDNLFTTLKKEKLTSYKLSDLGQAHYEISPMKFFEEDKFNSERFQIVKKVYEEYADIGMAGKALIKNQAFEFFSLLQDHKLTSKDYEVIAKYNIKEEDSLITSFDIEEEFEEIEKEIIDNILIRENNKDNLKILDNYCNKILEAKFGKAVIPIKRMQKAILNKIEYFELSNELTSKNEIPPKSNSMKV